MSYLDPELAEFLTARLDQAETVVRAAGNGEAAREWTAVSDESGVVVSVQDGQGHVVATVGGDCAGGEADYIAYNDPDAALRSIEADRWLVAEFRSGQCDLVWDEALALAVRCRAMAWSTHPDYQERWKPENLRPCRQGDQLRRPAPPRRQHAPGPKRHHV